MKLKHIAIIGTLFPILFSLVLFFGVLISADSDDENSNFSSGITGMNLSAEVLKHQPMVEKYAREYGISEYVNVLLAIIQVESGGTAEDVMQSSESLGLPPNSLDFFHLLSVLILYVSKHDDILIRGLVEKECRLSHE